MSSFSIQVKERNKLITKENTGKIIKNGITTERINYFKTLNCFFFQLKVNCVLIAEDVSKSLIFGKRLKSAYVDVVLALKVVENSRSGTQSNNSEKS